ncbi:DUF4845 domain-containing protein [Mangrovimicrobium sediminis]|uniref:DUF4845 domain-containing protein n=1 Tax=Mangrovimicrobium sediminis TaxID=2562682 RepID=A0A4Z0M4P6_9GAMM|nr:DUF4845 domain-containing protein [Haliea sp. SAOS-164]TGD74663.1 DUF4845 domain-containing protein [Haliea sp. SAOS-164]
MRTPQRQRGISVPSMIVLGILIGFYGLCIVKMWPHYYEYLTVKNIVETASAEFEPGRTTLGDIRRRVDAMFNTNRVEGITAKDVEVYNKKGVTYIDASYEARVHIAWRIDALLVFDDLLYEAGKTPD